VESVSGSRRLLLIFGDLQNRAGDRVVAACNRLSTLSFRNGRSRKYKCREKFFEEIFCPSRASSSELISCSKCSHVAEMRAEGQRKRGKHVCTCTYRLLIHAIVLFPSSVDVQNCHWKHPARVEGDDQESSSDTSRLLPLIIHATLSTGLYFSFLILTLTMNYYYRSCFARMLNLRTRMIIKSNRVPVFNFANFNNKLAVIGQITSSNLYSNLLASPRRALIRGKPSFFVPFFFHFRIRLCSAEFAEIYDMSQQSWLMHSLHRSSLARCIVASLCQACKSRIQRDLLHFKIGRITAQRYSMLVKFALNS
jgi:hypothetical protein